eukprot:TRINITY_DN2538_c0_g1_i20.p1 TRINITY_DN2538_c0_g1~~TRINITY_DN2538_c0_g1_i20.p1  ORF type:complete len:384 (-),score=89.38 TRINITY_DN2538_c0_g1_i20:72-1223(-)
MFFFLLDFEFCQYIIITDRYLLSHIFFFNDTATTEIYTILFVGSVRCVQETGINAEYMGLKKTIYLIQMKFILSLIFSLFFINFTLQIESESKRKLSTFSLDINVDYNQATQTMEQLKILKADYQGLKQKIVQNETKDYSQCLEFVVEHQCQKMDIWQAAIKELEIENKNSKEVQIPFLEQRKTSKVDKLKELLEMTSASEIEKEKISSQLEGNRKKVLGAVDLLKEVYSVSPKAEFVQKFSKQMKDLSALEIKNHIQNSVNLMQMQNKQDDTEKAKEPERELNEEVDAELNKAHLSYLEKDQQIQAQTTVNVIKSSESKITEALNFLSQSHDSKFKELKLEKQQLKEDIEQLRTSVSYTHLTLPTKRIVQISVVAVSLKKKI